MQFQFKGLVNKSKLFSFLVYPANFVKHISVDSAYHKQDEISQVFW